MTAQKHILLIDDDPLLRQMLAEQLALYEEFAIEEAASGAQALERVKAGLKSTPHDLVILDIGLPDLDGREVCRLMRYFRSKVPIVMLTGADTEADTIRGLDAGANDYVTKPFRFAVLLARVRTHLRQHEQSDDAVFAIGPYQFCPTVKMLVTEDGKRKIRLTDKEVQILKYLYRAGDKPVPRDRLLNEVWGYNAGVATHTLETHIYRLRKKIEPDPAKARFLINGAGGYRLNL